MDHREFFDRAGKIVIKPQNKPIKRRSSAYGIYIKDDLVLVIKPAWNNQWELPGGGIEDGETPEQAVKREFWEETRYKVQELNPILVYKFHNYFYANDYDEYYDSDQFYYQVLIADEADPIKFGSEETEKIDWIKISDLTETNCRKASLEAIKKAVNS